MSEDREGTEAHYRDAAYYDQAYRRRRFDVRFYQSLAESVGGPVLEWGCGTGRVSFAMAEHADVVGVDPMAEMLARAEARRARLTRRVRDRVQLRRGDIRSSRLRQRFPLVVAPFNVLMHLYTRQDLEKALANVARHLRRGGRFVFDVRNPHPRELGRDPQRVYRAGQVTRTGADGEKARYHYRERFDYDPVTQVQRIEMAFIGVDDPADFEIMPLAHRQFFPAELEALLHYNGFTVVERYGDFDRAPLDDESEVQVIVARARRRG